MAGRGFPLTVAQVMGMAFAISEENGSHAFGPAGPTEKWWRGYRKRHHTLSLRRPDGMDRGRQFMTTQKIIDDYFTLLKDVLVKNDLFNQPHLVFNCGSSAIDLNKASRKVVVPVRCKHAHSVMIAATEHVSALCCVNAAGNSIPPMIIYSGGFPGGAYSRNGHINALYGKSPSGFVNSELFLNWFEKIFLVHTPPKTTRLLLLDGHASHLSIGLIDKAIENSVILLCLPPHTTHMLQPLDVAVYRSLKNELNQLVSQARMFSFNLWISKKDFSSFFKQAFEKSFTMSTITAGFKKCGVFLFDPNAVDESLIQRSKATPLEGMTQITDSNPPSDLPTNSDSTSNIDQPSGTSRPCPPVMALEALEKAITPRQSLCFRQWWKSGHIPKDNPMFDT